jgi:hypothetical protein
MFHQILLFFSFKKNVSPHKKRKKKKEKKIPTFLQKEKLIDKFQQF